MQRLKISALIIAALAAGCANGGQEAQQSKPVNLKYDTTVQGKTYSVETQPLDSIDGYSYTVSVNGRKFIHQTIIPVVEGFHYFETPEDALNTGKVVVSKMIHSADLPSLTTDDLIMLGILTHDGSINTKK